MSYNYKDIHVVMDYDEASQFRYEHNDEMVEIGTAVGYDRPFVGMPGEKPPAGGWDKSQKPVMQMVCFDGVYFQSNTDD